MPNSEPISALLLILLTILIPPAGIFIISGCSADFLINLCLTLLGYFPGHIHAFYLEYVYYKRRESTTGGLAARDAPGVFSEEILSGGRRGQDGYGTIA